MIKTFVKSIIPEKFRFKTRLFVNRQKSVVYFGNKFYCICCDKSFRKFLPHGNITRENARCPYCGSLERTRLLQLYLESETDIFEANKRVLHFAPEQMLEKRFSRINPEYISADINPALADVIVDITQIQYPDNYFDYVICSHVLGHVPNETKAVDEIKRVLKFGGRALILTLISNDHEDTFEDNSIVSSEDRLKKYSEFDLVRLHGKDFKKRLTREGFIIHTIDYRLKFTKEEREKYSLGNGERELIFDCLKHK